MSGAEFLALGGYCDAGTPHGSVQLGERPAAIAVNVGADICGDLHFHVYLPKLARKPLDDVVEEATAT